MAIITISTSKFGHELGEVQFDTAKMSEAQILWAIENGLSQAATDSHASNTRDKYDSEELAVKAATESFAKWADKIKSGHVPSSGGTRARISPMEKALREAFTAWLLGQKMAESAIKKLYTGTTVKEAVLKLAEERAAKVGGDPIAMAESRLAKLIAEAEKLLEIKAPVISDDEF